MAYSKKRDQRPLSLIVLSCSLVLLYYVATISSQLAIYLSFGLAFGFVLQRSRFCFAASLRDPLITGSTSLLRALLVSLAIMTIAFALVQYIAYSQGAEELPGFVHPVGVHTVVGGFIFGLGMVVAGGCATGTLMRIGEGYLLQLMVLFGFIIGTLLGARSFPWWFEFSIANSPSIHLPTVLGWPGAVFAQLALIFYLYFLAKRHDDNNNIFYK